MVCYHMLCFIRSCVETNIISTPLFNFLKSKIISWGWKCYRLAFKWRCLEYMKLTPDKKQYLVEVRVLASQKYIFFSKYPYVLSSQASALVRYRAQKLAIQVWSPPFPDWKCNYCIGLSRWVVSLQRMQHIVCILMAEDHYIWCDGMNVPLWQRVIMPSHP